MNPTYSPSGELICKSCGKPIEQGMSRRGDSLARCENPDCQDTGTYEVGSFNHNPAPELRQQITVVIPPLRYTWGVPNWTVRDGEKVEDGHQGQKTYS